VPDDVSLNLQTTVSSRLFRLKT